MTVTQLFHKYSSGLSIYYVSDGVTFPGPGYTSSGFGVALNFGDHIITRLEAPMGKEFLVHDLVGTGVNLDFSTYWQ